MMPILEASTRSIEDFFDEHARLTGLIRQVEDALRRCSGSAVVVHKRIEQFCESLNAHFDFEEHGGYFGDALAIAPCCQGLADRLSAEHREFALRARELREHASLCDGGELWWEQLRSLFNSLVDDLKAHEEAERRLVRATCLIGLAGEE